MCVCVCIVYILSYLNCSSGANLFVNLYYTLDLHATFEILIYTFLVLNYNVCVCVLILK